MFQVGYSRYCTGTKFPLHIFLGQKAFQDITFLPRSIRKPANTSKKSIMVATSMNKGKINPMIVGPNEEGSGGAAGGSAEPGGKKAAYKQKVVPGWDSVSSNSAGHHWPTKKVALPKVDVVAGSPRGRLWRSLKAKRRRRGKGP
jgi:hypothetical protein